MCTAQFASLGMFPSGNSLEHVHIAAAQEEHLLAVIQTKLSGRISRRGIMLLDDAKTDSSVSTWLAGPINCLVACVVHLYRCVRGAAGHAFFRVEKWRGAWAQMLVPWDDPVLGRLLYWRPKSREPESVFLIRASVPLQLSAASGLFFLFQTKRSLRLTASWEMYSMRKCWFSIIENRLQFQSMNKPGAAMAAVWFQLGLRVVQKGIHCRPIWKGCGGGTSAQLWWQERGQRRRAPPRGRQAPTVGPRPGQGSSVWTS